MFSITSFDRPIYMNFPIIIPNWLDLPANVRAFTTTRVGGVSVGAYGDIEGQGGFNLGDHVGDDIVAVTRSREILAHALPQPFNYVSQVHGTTVLESGCYESVAQADAVFARRPKSVCAVLTADCLPVLFSDRDGKVVAAAHAGWRGLAGGVLQQTVRCMRESGASEIVAWLGPAIGPLQFEVGEDVRQAFSIYAGADRYFAPRADVAGKYLADIYGLAKCVLASVDVIHVSGGDHCTVSEPDKFYSYRRDGVTGRMASLIWIGD
jgi:polyphenol oxidase